MKNNPGRSEYIVYLESYVWCLIPLSIFSQPYIHRCLYGNLLYVQYLCLCICICDVHGHIHLRTAMCVCCVVYNIYYITLDICVVTLTSNSQLNLHGNLQHSVCSRVAD